MRISRQGNYAAIDTGIGIYTAEISAEDRTPATGVQPYFNNGLGLAPMRIGDFEIIPNGDQNTLPEELRTVLDENHIAPKGLRRSVELLMGQGPAQYVIEFVDGKRVKKWVIDQDIKNWLKTWDWEDYLLKAATDYSVMHGHFSKYFRNRAPRIGGDGKVAYLSHVSSMEARLEFPDEQKRINGIIVGDYNYTWRNNFRRYPVFDHRDAFRWPVAMRYSNLYSFALDNNYARPSIFGSLNWIKLSSSLPKLLMNFNANAAAIRYHIETPSIYWAQKEEQLKKNCELQNKEYKDEMLEDLKDEIFLKFAEGLIGIEKAGKMITSETIWDEQGNEYVGWKVTPLDTKVKGFIDAQLAIAKRADFEVITGIGIPPSLSDMSTDGNLSSGSEQLYAFKLYLATGVDIPESIVCKDINLALAVNFPGKDIKIGFYHDQVTTEESTKTTERIKNK